MKLPEIIGVAGTNGSGKDTLADIRYELQGCLRVTVSDILRRELRARDVALERRNLADLSRQWRDESGDNGILVTKTIKAYSSDKSVMGYKGLSVVSLRHPDEALRVKDHHGLVLWVDADPERFRRIGQSERNRIDDQKTFEEFLAEEEYDMNPGSDCDPARVNMGAVRELADLEIINNYRSPEEYAAHLITSFCLDS